MRLFELFDTVKISELKKDTMKSYVVKAGQDNVDRASSDSFKSGKNGDTYNNAPDDTRKDKTRKKGIDRALDKISKDPVNETKIKKYAVKTLPQRNFVAKAVTRKTGSGPHSASKFIRKEKHKTPIDE